MKTLVIDGIEFTDQQPTRPGWYLYLPEGGIKPFPVQVVVPGKADPDSGTLWHELIPKTQFTEEVRRAYKEGFEEGFAEGLNHSLKADAKPNWEYYYVESQAHAVATGFWNRSCGLTVVTTPFKPGE